MSNNRHIFRLKVIKEPDMDHKMILKCVKPAGQEYHEPGSSTIGTIVLPVDQVLKIFFFLMWESRLSFKVPVVRLEKPHSA